MRYSHDDSKQAEISVHIFEFINTLDVGGSEGQLTEVAIRLAEHGHRVTVGCLKRQGFYVDVLGKAGIEVLEFSPGASLTSFGGMKALLALARYLRHNNLDVVHTHDLYSNLLGVPAAWLARVPRIVSSRRDLGSWWWYTPRNRKILRSIQRLSHVVVANSEMVRQHLINHDGFSPAHVRVLYNGIDVERFANVEGTRNELGSYSGNKLIAVSANMHTHTKGHDRIITAAQTVCSAIPDCVFVFIGDGALRSQFERKVRSLALEENFLFLGQRNDVAALLARCDVGLLASSAEGLPNAVLEYMAAGLPVVATSVGGIPEIIGQSQAGLLVPPETPDALADALIAVLKDPAKAKAMGQAGKKRVHEEFSFDRLLEDLQNLYSEIRRVSDDQPASAAGISGPHNETARLPKPRSASGHI
jgi:glycosyltransferase involved in cell wall biosynthesis